MIWRAEVRSRSCCCRSWDWLLRKARGIAKWNTTTRTQSSDCWSNIALLQSQAIQFHCPFYFLSHKFSGIMQQTSPESARAFYNSPLQSISSCAERIIIMNMHRNQVFFIAPCLAHKWNFIAAHTPQYSLISTFSIDKIIKLFDRLWLLTCSVQEGFSFMHSTRSFIPSDLFLHLSHRIDAVWSFKFGSMEAISYAIRQKYKTRSRTRQKRDRLQFQFTHAMGLDAILGILQLELFD